MAKKKAAKSAAPKIEVFSDITGRVLMGERVDASNAKVVTYKNPAVIHAQIQQQGQIQVSAFPLIFAEFLKDPTAGSTWDFPVDSIVNVDGEPAERLVGIYNNVVNPSPIAQPASSGIVAPDGTPAAATPTKVINLFDE